MSGHVTTLQREGSWSLESAIDRDDNAKVLERMLSEFRRGGREHAALWDGWHHLTVAVKGCVEGIRENGLLLHYGVVR